MKSCDSALASYATITGTVLLDVGFRSPMTRRATDGNGANSICYPNNFCVFLADQVSQKLQNNNIFTIAKRNVDGQDMLYQSLKLTNGIWVLAELKIQPGNPRITVSTPAPLPLVRRTTPFSV